MAFNQKEEEIEVKFYISNLEKITEKILSIGAVLTKPRVFESNLRYDYPDGSLRENKQVLRLRKDSQSYITFKGPAQIDQPVSMRQEIEITVDNFERAQHLLEALGFEAYMVYEKYRTTYQYQELIIVVDELPIGNFIEIEGPTPFAIHNGALKLGVSWDARIPASYLYLFEQVKQHIPELRRKNLTFAELSQVQISPEEMGVDPADP